MQHITKLCADSLRAYTQDKYDYKLQSSHAHELVAAFLGYNTKAALLADKKLNLDKLSQAEFIVFDADNITYAHDRFVEFGYALPTGYELAEQFRWAIRNEPTLAPKFQHSFREVAIEIAKAQLDKHLKMWRMTSNAIEWEIDGHLLYFYDNGDAKLEAWINYPTDNGERLRHSSFEIRLKPISANLGWGKPEVMETRYSGLARKLG